jgi:hypothetical protein
MLASDFDEVVERSHTALLEISRGNAQPFVEMYSNGDDVTLANPFGGVARGQAQGLEMLAGAASHYSDGEIVSFETSRPTWLTTSRTWSRSSGSRLGSPAAKTPRTSVFGSRASRIGASAFRFDTTLLILIALDRETIALRGRGACMWRQRGVPG